MPDLKFKAGTDRRNCASVFTSLISMAAKQFTRTLECPFRPTNVNQTNLSFNHLRIKCVDLHWTYEISKVQNADYILFCMLKKNDSIRWDLSNLKQRKKLVFLLKTRNPASRASQPLRGMYIEWPRRSLYLSFLPEVVAQIWLDPLRGFLGC